MFKQVFYFTFFPQTQPPPVDDSDDENDPNNVDWGTMGVLWG